jgi:Flp pilus assembly CpaE family ATPase
VTEAVRREELLDGSRRLRLALALGDQEREQRFRPALESDDELVVVAQCLAADQLLAAVESRVADVVIVAYDLHRLTESIVRQVALAGLPLVLLDREPDSERWRDLRGTVLPLDIDAVTLRQAVTAAARGDRRATRAERHTEESTTAATTRREAAHETRTVIAVAGGHGSPGRTTVAINVAAALGAAAPTVLADLDLSSPTVTAYLDLDPSRNICTLAHAVREDTIAWSRALAEELQPLGRRSPSGRVLGGLPKRELRATISPRFVERLVGELARQYRFVILDLGAELMGTDAAASGHRAVLASANATLVVASADLIGLWHARTALGVLTSQLQIDPTSLSLVINRYDSRHHHGRSEIEWHLGVTAASVIPHDQRGAQTAIVDQRPLVLDATSRAGRSLLAFSERVYAGRLRLPAEQSARGTGPVWERWRRLAFARLARLRGARTPRAAASLVADPVLAQTGADRRRAW